MQLARFLARAKRWAPEDVKFAPSSSQDCAKAVQARIVTEFKKHLQSKH
jgi:hypothetical protein